MFGVQCCCSGEDDASGKPVLIVESQPALPEGDVNKLAKVDEYHQAEPDTPRLGDSGKNSRSDDNPEVVVAAPQAVAEDPEVVVKSLDPDQLILDDAPETRIVSEADPYQTGVSMALTFAVPDLDGGDEFHKTVVITMRPLGLDFKKSPPFTVRRAEGHSAELGVQPGWSIQRAGSVDLRSEADLDAMCVMLATLPLTVRMVVQQEDGGDTKTVVIKSRPLGLEFMKTPPFSIKNVAAGGHAETLGLQQGWLVRQVGATDLAADADVKPALDLLARLPQA